VVKIRKKQISDQTKIDFLTKDSSYINVTKFIFKILATIFFGIIFVLIFFETILFAFGKLERIIHKVQNNFSKTDEFVILALGESTTAPVYDFNMQDFSWPAYLEKLLNKADLKKEIKVINEGESRINSDKILYDLDRNIEKYNPDLVISMMGSNDFVEGILYETSAGIEADSLLSKSRIYKLVKFLIASIKEKNELESKEELDCYSEESCIHLASIQGDKDFFENEIAIRLLKKALDYNPNNAEVLISLGYRTMSDYNLKENTKINAINYFEKSLEINPRDANAYSGLIQYFMQVLDFSEQWNEVFIKNTEKIEENIEKYKIKDENLFLTLANCADCHGINESVFFRSEKRFNYLQKALTVNPNNQTVLTDLARYHTQYNNFKEAEQLYLRVLKTNKKDDVYIMALIELANLYLKTDRQTLAEETFKKAIDIGGIYVKNYQKLYEILQSNNIKLIAVGYPMRSTQPLELMFSDSEVLVVSNELNFKKAVEKEGYDQIFVDRFAGDFGHCSEKGNLLLAENVKLAILENWEKISGEN